ncbi:hypothetical protein [Sansalvadorimonas verongulae]|uniref:hypothetical protein n=1 Tax=Sansalvadorimonas verongulae TaxID=2172824 RepID=UPI0012BBF4C9|nr:hypothetical protein [Sansalvadorimonas verongulae]MTI14565.1 hypothetical protein [Sansalvadorimonas verongulae]
MGAVSPEFDKHNSEYVHFLDKSVDVTPAQCELGYSREGNPMTRKSRCRSCALVCCHTLINRIQRACNTRALFISGIGGAAVLAGGAVISMSLLTNGLSLQTMLPNVMAGAAASSAGMAAGGGLGLVTLSVVGTLWWCVSSCRYLCRSPENRLLKGFKEAYDKYEDLTRQENYCGPLPPEKAFYKTYLADGFMKPRAAECKNILLQRNADQQEMYKYGFVAEASVEHHYPSSASGFFSL